MSRFDRYDRLASRAVDWINAEPFTLTPMITEANDRPGKDESRPIVEGRGVFEYGSAEAGLQLGVRKSYREANDFRNLRVGRVPTLSVDRRFFPTVESLPRQGDIIFVPESATREWEVTSAQPDGHSRILIKLVARGQGDMQVQDLPPLDEDPAP